uniref:Uncharacterized protein n=1 Tax=Moniliophthora roreri TaxID=221103 RepID=A0A0W0F244_MONRR
MEYGQGVQHLSIAPLLCTASFIDKFKSVDANLWQSILVKLTAALGLSEAIGRDDGNAVRDGINAVTIKSITYIACQVSFMLTTHNTWSHTVGGFNIFAFYHNIITIFKAGPLKWQEETLDWWNKQVLQPADSIGDEPKEGLDMALALAQAAEANVTAANPTPSDPANGTQPA